MRSFRSSAVLSLVSLVPIVPFVACDSPGGGGGGGVNCTLNPELQVCQDTSGGSDATGGDTRPDNNNDGVDTTTTFDTGDTFDTSPPTDTTPTDTTPIDTTPPACVEQERRCGGFNGIEICLDGRWVSGGSCEGATCVDGECQEPIAECEGSERRCSGSTVEVCSAGEWVSSATCPSGCTNGTCNTAPPGGDLDCLEVMSCGDTAGCFAEGTTDAACMTECFQQASTVGRSEASAMLSCYDGCDWDAECAYSSCEPQRAACLFTGTGSATCLEIDECLGTCSDEACSDACFASGSAAAQAQRLWVVDCASLYCADLSDQACLSEVFGAGGPCEAAYNDCFN